MTAVFGIDLGTTYSVIARVDESGRPVVIANDSGGSTTPSVVHFPERGRVVVGQEAKAVQKLETENTVSLIKNLMGQEVSLTFHGETFTPEAISAMILRYLAHVANNGEDGAAAVVTVPAHFGIAEREATQQAAMIAGLEILDLVAEPVAAAISYGLASRTGGNALVYDLGGGTFDATVVALTDRGPQVVVTDGIHELGGTHWDTRLANYMIDSLIDLVAPQDDPYDDEEFMHTVMGEAENLKIALTRRPSVHAALSFQGRSARFTLTRERFDEVTADLLDTTLSVARRAVIGARDRGAAGIDLVVLVGGSSRMPQVREAIEREFGVPTVLEDPDFAVAKGAAIRASHLASMRPSGRAGIRAPRGGDSRGAAPRALGLLIWDSTDSSGTKQVVAHVVERNDPLPVNRKARFATVLDGQDRVRIQVYEQAGAIVSPELGHNRAVLDGMLSDLPDLPAGSPIEVTFLLGHDGRLRLSAVEPGSGRSLVLESFVEGVLDTAEVEELTRTVGRLMIGG